MSKIKIITDSTAELTPEIIEKYDITVLPLTIRIDNEEYRDGIDIQSKEFIDKMLQANQLPQTSQPAPILIEEAFQSQLDKGNQVIAIHLSSGLSGTVKTAAAFAAEYPEQIRVIDSWTISKLLGYAVKMAAEMSDKGHSLEEIEQALYHLRECSHTYVTIDKLDNLVKGGRLSKASGILGTLLNIKILTKIEDGVLQQVGKVRSTKQIIKLLLDSIKKDLSDGKKVVYAALPHADSIDIAQKIREEFEQLTGYYIQDEDVDITTPIVSTHTGVGAVGILFVAE